MAKEKIHKLAQEFHVSSESLIQLLRSMGIPVKSHMSTVDETLREEIKKRFDAERAEIKKEYERKKQKLEKERSVTAESALPRKSAQEPTPPTTVTAPPAPAPQPAAAPPLTASVSPATAHPPTSTHTRPRSYALPPGRDTIRTDFVPRPTGGPPRTGAAFPRPEGFPPRRSDMPPLPFSERGGFAERRRRKGAFKKQKFERSEVDEIELKANVRRTLAQIGAGVERRKYRKERAETAGDQQSPRKTLNVSEFVTVSELANMMNVPSPDVIAKCLELGLFVTVNQRIDFETIALVADEFGFTAQLMPEYSADEEGPDSVEDPSKLKPRAPVVTVMGHVDHGKTSLLDFIRKTNVIAGEAGGITQHIAAYEVRTAHGPVTFLDTPGHEAFTAMRARGSQVTDVVVLVVAADSGVMPQTKEAIDHARAANVPIVVAINKIDLPTANPAKVKAELAACNVLVEEYGGKVSCVEISARTGAGVDKLLETLALEAELLELKADPDRPARGVVIESELDKGKGPIATVLIQKGTLRRGDAFVTGIHSGRVRELLNERGGILEEARPGQPVVVLGMDGTPQAGDSFKVVSDEKEAREISARRRLAQKERELRRISAVSLDHLHEQIVTGKVKTLNLVIKGDVDGSVEALATSLERLSTDEIKLHVIHKSVGAIKEADIMLAEASNALIVGFHLSPNPKIREFAKKEGVEIRLFRIIYEAVDAIKKAMEGMLPPEIRETVIGSAEVRKVFKVSKVGYVAGCAVLEGKIVRGANARLIRDDIEIADTTVSSLRRNQDEAREVAAGLECGVVLAGVSDYREADRIEVYERTEIARKLA